MTTKLKSAIKHHSAPALIIAIVATGFILPSLSLGLLSDDFSWMNLVRNTASMSWAEYLKVPSPYGYFRPVPMAIFRILGLAFPGQLWPFRALAIMLHLSNCLLLYLLVRRLCYPPLAALTSSLLFAVLPCHAEPLFWISALNEPLSAFLLLVGFYLLLSIRLSLSAPLSTLLFTTALASRESALCYLPLLLLLTLRRPDLKSSLLFPVLLLPGAVYLALRLWWSLSLPAGMTVSSPGGLSLNPLEMGRRLVHYAISMAMPVKTLFGVAGFERYELLRRWLSSPLAFPSFYWTLAVASSALLAAAAWYILAEGGRVLAAPLAFTVLSLAVYLPFGSTSEHFLYFPSLGFCLAVALLLQLLSSRKARLALALALTLFSVYSASRAERLYRWKGASAQLESSLSGLESLVSALPAGSMILVKGLDNRYHGIPFVGEHSLQDAWSWRNPRRPLRFYFDRTGCQDMVIEYSPATFTFHKVE